MEVEKSGEDTIGRANSALRRKEYICMTKHNKAKKRRKEEPSRVTE
jgi:hypothetical protein